MNKENSKSECIKVIVRCRPLGDEEIKADRQCVVNVNSANSSITVMNPKNPKEPKVSTFDFTYDYKASQELIFNQTAKPILESVMQGYNGTIFAYGQTGTGKTFTMEGVADKQELKGIIPRSIEWIFNSIKSYSDQNFLVRVSFVEIYNEEVIDLLNKNIRNKLSVHEKDGVFYVEDCKILKVENAQQMIAIMNAGRQNRSTGSTKMNKDSSRSHSIFQIIIENSSVDDAGETHYRMGKLNLVDLAGSEKHSKTETTGKHLMEGIKINLSLTILGNVISKLVTGKNQHIPYRESMLTKLLCDSLGGNTKTVMIANVGPADMNVEETINTLRYAETAKKIKNKPIINEDPKDAQLRKIQEEIEFLKKQLEGGMGGDGKYKMQDGKNKEDDENNMKSMMEKIEREKEDYKMKQESEIQKIRQQKDMAEEEKNKLILKINKEIEENKKLKDESKAMLLKYREKKKKVLKGNETEKKVKEQETEIIKNQEVLEVKKREEMRLQEELKEQSRRNMDLKKKYESYQANIDDLNEKINMLRARIEEIKGENKENQERLNLELANLQDEIRVIHIANLKKDFIMENFIPIEEREKIGKCLEFNEKDNSYFVNKIEAIKNNYKSNRDILKKMKKTKIDAMNSQNNLFKYDNTNQEEQIINLRLELPEKLVLKFKGEPNEQIYKEIEHILKDNDSDLLYYDKELNLFDNNLNESFLRTIVSSTARKSSDGNISKDSNTNLNLNQTSKTKSTQNTSLNQSAIKDPENPKPRRMSSAKKPKKEQ